MAKIERFLNNEEAVIEAISGQWQVMKYIKLKRPDMLSKNFCFLAYRANLKDQDEVVKFIPAEFWNDFRFCMKMMTESPMCLRYTPLPNKNILRRLFNCEWLIFEDERPS